MSPKLKKIVYWVITGLLAFLFFFSGFMAVQSSPEYLEGIEKMGFPKYFPRIHGILKLLGTVALLIPRQSILKHWAYAGLSFTLLFAAIAHAQVNEPFFVQLVALGLLMVSYYLYNKEMNFKSL